MNILYVSNDVTFGGAVQSLIDTLRIVKKNGITPIVIIPGKGIIETFLIDLNVKFYIINFIRGYGPIGLNTKENDDKYFCNNFNAALRIQNIIKEEKIDLIHFNSSVSNVGAFAALLADIPYVWFFREILKEHYNCEFWDKEVKSKLVHYADAVIAISNVIVEAYRKEYGSMIRVYNGIDSERYEIDLINYKECKGEVQNFLITGVISEDKGQWDAIKAFKCLVEEGIKNIHLTIIGEGSEKFLWILKRFIDKNALNEYIEILPFEKDLSQYRDKAQYSLTTSKMEALGRCTIEAMFAGNIVIGADTGGTKEIIGEDEDRGYLYKQGDYKNLADVIKKVILQNDEEKSLCRKKAQEYVEKVFSLENYADNLCNIYNEVLQKRSVNKPDKKEFVNELKKRYLEISNNNDTKINIKEQTEYEKICEEWEKISNKGHKIWEYLLNHKYRKIAIYGIGNLGIKVYEEIEESPIEISYVVDRNSSYIEEVLKVVNPNDILPEIDLLLVAVAKEEKEIINKYKEKYTFPVMGISDIINEIAKEVVV